jgi:hypothetical protein
MSFPRDIGSLAALLALVASVTTAAACRGAAGAPHASPAPPGGVRDPLQAVPRAALCFSAGQAGVTANGAMVRVDAAGSRAEIRGDARARSAEIAFTYLGPSTTTEPLANGERRRQIGLKLRALDTCNVIYVMWHVEPTPGVAVSVKRNPGASKHAECGAGGYENIKPGAYRAAPSIQPGLRHVLRATLDGGDLVVVADGIVVWTGALPADALSFDGPAGLRTDNGRFDLELRVPPSGVAGIGCP